MGGHQRRGDRLSGSRSPGELSSEEQNYIARCAELKQAPDPSVLTTLSTRWWFLAPSTPFGAGGCLALVEVLAASRTITSLTLRCDPSQPAVASHAADARALATMLRRNTSLTTLDLSYCGLDDLAVSEIAAALERATAPLRTVKLEGNQFGDAGCAALTRHIKGSPVRVLDVSNNGLYFTGMSRLHLAAKRTKCHVESVGNYTTEEILNVGAGVPASKRRKRKHRRRR